MRTNAGRASLGLLTLLLGGCSLLVDAKAYNEGGDEDAAVDSGLLDAGTDATDSGGTDAAADSGGTDAGPPGCDCGDGEICLVGGYCVSTTGCPGPEAPSCGGAGEGGELPPIRVFSVGTGHPTAPTRPRPELHLTERPDTNRGWAIFWRGGEQASARVALVNAGDGGCYEAQLAFLLQCNDGGSPPIGQVNYLDVRTMGDAGTALATEKPMDSGVQLSAWTIRAESSTGICAERVNDNETSNDTKGLSLIPYAPDITVDWVLNPNIVRTVFTSTALLPFNSVDSVRGDLAANRGISLAVGSNRFVRVHKTSLRLDVAPISLSMEPGPAPAIAAAVDPMPTRGDGHYFVVRKADNALAILSCNSSTTRCGGATTGVPGTLPTVPEGPTFAAYRLNGEVTVVAAGEDGFALRRHVGSSNRILLDDTVVDGRLQSVIAVDAEVLREIDGTNRVGWNEVWAALVEVDRAGERKIELWTGARRTCTP